MATAPTVSRGEIWLAKDSAADAFQTKSVSQSRFVRLLGQLNVAQLDDIASAIALCIGAP
jgi:mRNA-degrading endonuclease toxin of MazEF toxin-antitoxin module